MYTRRIVVTGLGAMTPVGNDARTFWQSLVEGRSGVRPIEGLAGSSARPSYAAEVKDLTPEVVGLPRKRLKIMGRQAQLAHAAVVQAWNDAALGADGAVDRRRLGIILGVGMLNADADELGRACHVAANGSSGEPFDIVEFGRRGAPELFPLWLLRHIPNLAAAHASISLDAQGPSNTIATGCAAGANAIGEAARLIARGDADVILAGGTDARTTAFALLRYRELGWLATREDVPPAAASAPFDRSATGFVSGEGAGVVVLESLEHARRRGAPIRAELAGYAAANDAHDVLTPHPAGRGFARALSVCLERTAITRDDVDVVFAPAASVPSFDRAIACSLGRVLSTATGSPVITATRSILGHTHAASCALDCIAAVLALQESEVPATLNLCSPIADLPFVRGASRRAPIATALVGAYGFGGQAAALAWRRYQA
jgi:3-oxoacyl-[acyl-carrier-protein] synthase II